jgi:hypothetical protein
MNTEGWLQREPGERVWSMGRKTSLVLYTTPLLYALSSKSAERERERERERHFISLNLNSLKCTLQSHQRAIKESFWPPTCLDHK